MTALILVTVIGLVISVVGLCMTDQVLKLVNAKADILTIRESVNVVMSMAAGSAIVFTIILVGTLIKLANGG